MKTLFKSFACLLALGLAVPALAGTIKEYTADMVNVKTGLAAQKLAVTPDKIYIETLNDQGKLEAIAIVRLDQKKMYFFMEEAKSYLELPFDKDRFTAADLTMGLVETKEEKVGSETVGGYQADKIQTTIKVMGVTTEAYQWMAPEFEPLPIRTEAEGVTLEMRNISPGSPDSSLFEIPQGYNKDERMEQMMKVMMGGK
jgi:hypothetical protein